MAHKLNHKKTLIRASAAAFLGAIVPFVVLYIASLPALRHVQVMNDILWILVLYVVVILFEVFVLNGYHAVARKEGDRQLSIITRSFVFMLPCTLVLFLVSHDAPIFGAVIIFISLNILFGLSTLFGTIKIGPRILIPGAPRLVLGSLALIALFIGSWTLGVILIVGYFVARIIEGLYFAWEAKRIIKS